MLKPADRDRITSFFADRYGIPHNAFSEYIFFETGRSVWMVTSTQHDELIRKATEMKRIEFPGLRILRKVGRWLKPTTYALQIIGSRATRHIKELTREELTELFNRGYLEVVKSEWEEGYIIALYNSIVIGCLLYREGRLKHQFPRGRTDALAKSGLY